MKKILKGCFCPNCKKKLFRRRSIRIRDIKPTTCGSCGFVIKNPHEIFVAKKKKKSGAFEDDFN